MKQLRPPVVTDIDRQWAIDRKPADWDETTRGLDWADWVGEEIERFERKMGEDRKYPEEWSGLWRRVWMAKTEPALVHPDTAPPRPPCKMVRRSDPQWSAAMAVCTPRERALAERLGVMPFKPDDERLPMVLPESVD